MAIACVRKALAEKGAVLGNEMQNFRAFCRLDHDIFSNLDRGIAIMEKAKII